MSNGNTIKTEELLRLICHDLAGPLQTLGMSIELLAERCPEDQQKLVERMKRSTDSISQILTLVRELQAFSAGKKELKLEAVNLDAVIEQNLFDFQEKMNKKNLSLIYTKDSNQPSPMVLAEFMSL